jgi:hypothetical protein
MASSNTLSELVNLKVKLCEGYANQIINHMVSSGCITEDGVQDHYAEILSILSLGKTSPNTISFTKKPKDPNAPKKPGVWTIFRWNPSVLQEIKDAIADEGEEITFGSISTRASAMYKALSKEDRKPYEDEYTQKNILYQEALKAYKASNPDLEDEHEVMKPKRKRKKKSKVAPCPTAVPEEFTGEWLGPFDSTFLFGSVKGVVFSTLDEALIAANERADCVGVTRSNRGYSIRFGYKDSRPQFQGSGIKDYEDLLYSSPSNETSFIKQTAADNYKANGPNEKLSSSSDESVKKTKKKSQTKKKSKTKKVKLNIIPSKPQSKKSKTKKKQPEQKISPVQLTHEADTDDSSAASENGDNPDVNSDVTVTDIDTQPQADDEATKVKVTTITLGGTDYLLDTKNKVYDATTHDFVGKFDNGSINFDAEDSQSEFSE